MKEEFIMKQDFIKKKDLVTNVPTNDKPMMFSEKKEKLLEVGSVVFIYGVLYSPVIITGAVALYAGKKIYNKFKPVDDEVDEEEEEKDSL